MRRTLTLNYVPEADDVFELLADSPGRRRRRNRAVRNAITVLLLLCCVLWAGTVEPTTDTLLPSLFLAVLLGKYTRTALVLGTRWGLRRRARTVWRRSPTLRLAHEEEIGPEGLTLRTEGLSQSHAWSRFGGFRESGRQFVLLDRAGEPCVVLPKRGLPEEALVPVCHALLAEYLAGPPSPGSATAPTDGPPAPAGEPGP